MNNIAIVTTFPNYAWPVYAKAMLESYVANWPSDVSLLARLDDGMLSKDADKILRPQDGIICGTSKEHAEFLNRNKDKDHKDDYRKQACRFSHKVFTLYDSANHWINENKKEFTIKCRYLIWLDADVLTTRKVTHDDLIKCLPKEGEAVAYLGRKDWPHSECGWLAFDLDHGGFEVIEEMRRRYIADEIFKETQWDDSYIWDRVREFLGKPWTNLSPEAKGLEAWPSSPMAEWSKHYKGPVAKAELSGAKVQKHQEGRPMRIETKNSIPDESIQKNILENQTLIKNWVTPCLENDEEVVIVSAGPMLVPEDLRPEIKAGRKIFAVKHALQPLKAAGIKPFGCILLDPRPHVYDFVENPDTEVNWFVASQVTPKAVRKLLEAGCKVFGYHASVGAKEDQYTNAQPFSIVDGGSATATRGLFLLAKMGFRKFRLYGYDLCVADKPNLSEVDEMGQPRFFEVSIEARFPFYHEKRAFWSKGELLAQYEEFRRIVEGQPWKVLSFGNGIASFITEAKRISDLRLADRKAKLSIEPKSYEEFLGCKSKTPLLARWRNMLPRTLRRPSKVSSY